MTISPRVNHDPVDTALHLGFLDGMRGLAAMYVVFFHVYQPLTFYGALTFPVNIVIGWAGGGRFAVTVFIVLSGFVLMLPVSRSPSYSVAGGLTGFLGRRAWRILPPYFAALVFYIVVTKAFESILSEPSIYGNIIVPVMNPVSLLTHALLVHNLSIDWVYKINGAWWSVATEWQIYFVFALVLLPLSRRVPIWATVPFGLALGLAGHIALRIDNAASLWLIGVFAMGMVACGKLTGWQPLPWSTIAAATGAVAAVLIILRENHLLPLRSAYSIIALDILVGFATASFLIACVQRPALAAKLDTPLLRRLGACSYSVYLMHYPALVIADALLRRAVVSQMAHLTGLLLVGVPVALALGLLLYLVAERPVMRRAKHMRRSTSQAG